MAKKKYIDDTPAVEGTYEVVATKISKLFLDRLKHICKCKGLSLYAFIQMAIETIARYCDDRHNLSYEMEMAMSVFEHLEGWKNHYNLADPTHEPHVKEAVYFVGHPEKKGCRAVLVDAEFCGMRTETYDPKLILERTLANTTPELYKRYRRIGADMHTSCALETLMRLSDEYTMEDDLRAIRAEFEDNNRGDFGQKPHEGGPYRRKMHKSVEQMEQELGFRPYDQEA